MKNGTPGESQIQDPRGRTAAHLEASSDERLILWFERWREPMRRWLAARSTVPSADLDDLAQEAFVRLMRYSKDAVIENPQSYLYRIAINVMNEWRERARNSLPHDDVWLDDLQIDVGDEPENTVARTLVHQRVRAELRQLPPRQRDVVLLHMDENLTYKQIAQRLQLTTRVVRRDLSRAYSRLRENLGRPDV